MTRRAEIIDGTARASPSRRDLLGALTALAAAGVAPQAIAQTTAAAPQRRPSVAMIAPPRSISIEARQIAGFDRTNASRRQFGRLEFRGGLALTSPLKEFGGWSGLVMDDDGRRMLAVSDRGGWLMADIAYASGRPTGLQNATIGEIGGIGGRSLMGRDVDAESITLLEGTLARGTVLIAFERNHRIGRFPIGPRGIEPPNGYLKMPADLRRVVSFNKGLEAVCVIRGGALRGSVVAFAEEGLDERRHHTGWLWPGGMAGEPQRLNMTSIGDFAITDAVSLADGSLIVLERKFRWLEGIRMRLRLVRAATVRPGAVMEGETLLEADMSSDIDNMEGLALSRDPRGQPLLTLISDNNFNSFLQRNILLQFALGPEISAKAR